MEGIDIGAIIVKYWLEFLLAAFGAIMTAWCKKLKDKLKTKVESEKIKEDAIVEGLKAVLHDILFQICEDYVELGYIPIDKMEKLKNREKIIYKAYNGLNGNSTGTDIHEAFNSLPFKNPDDKEDEA